MNSTYWIKHIAGSLIFFSLLFISAGRVNYMQGWVYVAIGLIMIVLNYTVLRINPDLLEERSKPGENAKKWDKMILGLSFLITILMYIVAGLDSGRFHWSPDFNLSFTILGIFFTALGQLFFLIAQKQNRFFSTTVRIQTERAHTVCETGLYKIVRHPAYLGSVIQALGFPLIFNSLWSIIPAAALIILLITRTNLEDKTLNDELKGYTEYAEKTRYKIIPFLY